MTPLVSDLTRREEEVLMLVGTGLGMREIAHRIGVSYSTARKYRDTACHKLGAASTSQAAVIVALARARARKGSAPG